MALTSNLSLLLPMVAHRHLAGFSMGKCHFWEKVWEGMSSGVAQRFGHSRDVGDRSFCIKKTDVLHKS